MSDTARPTPPRATNGLPHPGPRGSVKDMKLIALTLAATLPINYTVTFTPDTNEPLAGQPQAWMCTITPEPPTGKEFFTELQRARTELRTNLLHRYRDHAEDITALDHRIAYANKFGQSEAADKILDHDVATMARILTADGFKASELDFFFSSIPAASTDIPLGVVEDTAVGATYTREAAARTSADELAAELEAALSQDSLLVPSDASEPLQEEARRVDKRVREEAARVRFDAPSYHEALLACEQGIDARNGTSAGSFVREPAGAEFRPVEIFGIVVGALSLTGLIGWLYTIAKHFDVRRILP